MSRPVVAYQLSLLGEPPKPGLAWEPPLYAWRWAGIIIPPSEDAMRQARLMRRDSDQASTGADRA